MGYSSSSEEEESEADTGAEGSSSKRPENDAAGGDSFPVRKKLKTEIQLPETSKLPLPGCLLSMFPEEVDSQTEDPSLHGGRIRSFKHERGNWATYVYLPYHPEDEFVELLEELLAIAKTHAVVLNPQEEFHLSVSQTVVLRHHWIQPFTQSLRKGLLNCRRFVCTAERLKVYCNAERTRTFLGLEVCTGHAQLLDLVQTVDKTMSEFGLDTFYEKPSFHVSLAWCVGDLIGKMNTCVQELQRVVEDKEEDPFLLNLDCTELRCRTGNKTFSFPLKQ